jgi:pimeloyl-ACP methyl ester carboxylesterase
MQVVVQDLITSYSRFGKGKQVLILHGWGDSSASWKNFAKRLAVDYEVIVLDLPGFGKTQPPDTAWNLTNYAEFVQAFIRKLAVKPYAIIGHSNGGAIAVRGVGQGILQTDKLILFASHGVRGTKTRKALYIVSKVGKVMASPLPMNVQVRLRNTLYRKAGSDLLVAEHMQETFKRIVRDDVRVDAAYISTPTLLVYGELDTEAPVSLGRQLHDAIEGSVFQVLPGVGHFLHHDAEDRTLELAREFLDA